MEIVIGDSFWYLIGGLYLGWMWSFAFHAVVEDKEILSEFTIMEHVVGIFFFPLSTIIFFIKFLFRKLVGR